MRPDPIMFPSAFAASGRLQSALPVHPVPEGADFALAYLGDAEQFPFPQDRNTAETPIDVAAGSASADETEANSESEHEAIDLTLDAVALLELEKSRTATAPAPMAAVDPDAGLGAPGPQSISVKAAAESVEVRPSNHTADTSGGETVRRTVESSKAEASAFASKAMPSMPGSPEIDARVPPEGRPAEVRPERVVHPLDRPTAAPIGARPPEAQPRHVEPQIKTITGNGGVIEGEAKKETFEAPLVTEPTRLVAGAASPTLISLTGSMPPSALKLASTRSAAVGETVLPDIPADLSEEVRTAIAPSASATAASAGLSPTGGTLLGQSVSQQIVASVIHAQAGMTELALNPEELGRVRLQIMHVDGVLSVLIQAERPETADLLRRHIDHLAQEFRSVGFDALDLRFSDHPGGKPTSQNRGEMGVELTSEPVNDAPPPAANPSPEAAGGLDIRI